MSQELQELVSRVVDGRYRLDHLIAFGGMGAVFRATQLPLGYEVALKVLHPHLSSDDATAKRFEREAYSASKLSHPNCVKVIDYGSTLDGITYMSMELLEGVELKSLLDVPMAPGLAVDRMIQMLEGLGHAHEHGIIHRDLKPANVFMTHDSRGAEVVKIVDFGIARVLEDIGVQEKLTLTGIVYGTPHYMSPEQATGGSADARSDIYAAGLIFYRMLAGRPPFQAQGAGELMRMQIIQPPDLLPHEVPRILAHIVARMLEKDPGRRYGSTREIIERLERMRPLLQGVEAAPLGPPPAAPLPGPSPAQSMMPPLLRASSDGDTAPLGAGSWQDAAAASLAGREGMRGPAPSGRQVTVLPWLLMAVAGGVAIAAVGMLAWQRRAYETELMGLRAQAEPSAESVPEEITVPTPLVSPALSPESRPVEPPSVPAVTVALTIRTNIEASILDAADHGIYGRSNGKDPVLLERSDEAVEMILRAPGYVDLPVSVTPTEDRVVTLDLVREPSNPKRTRPKSVARSDSSQSRGQTPDEPPVQKPATPPESLDGAKLRDPFDG